MARRTGITQQGEATRQAILRAAERLFAEQGYSATRVEDIASAAGIRAATLLYYFSSKQTLYDEVDKNIFVALQEKTNSHVEKHNDPWDIITAIIDGWLEFLVDRPTAARIFQRNIAGSSMEHIPAEFSGPETTRFAQIIRDGQSTGIFRNINISHFLNIIGGSLLHFVCMERGKYRSVENEGAEEASLNEFRAELHIVARSLLKSSNGPLS